MSETLLVRADASARIGTGHVMRCLALAQAWKDLGGHAVLASVDLAPRLAGRWLDEGLEVREHSATPFSAADEAATVAAAAELRASAVVLDGYGFGPRMQSRCRAPERVVAVLDDNRENADFAADFVLNPNLHAREADYADRAVHTQLLLGPHYALLRREFVRAQPPHRPYAQARRLLVTLGGADVQGLTQRIVEAIVGLGWDGHLDVVLGPSARADAPQYPRVEYHRDVRDMVPLMQSADLAVSAAGSTCWELARLGVPVLLIVAADNQRGVASSLEQAGIAHQLGTASQLSLDQLGTAFKLWIGQPATLATMSERATRLVDGQGARRVAEFLSSSPARSQSSSRAGVH